MKNIFLIKNSQFKTFLYSAILNIALMILMIPLFIFNYFYIPLGIFIGILINSLSYLAFYFVENKEKMNHSVKLSSIINILRFVLIASFAILFAILEYVYFIKVANFFAIIGGYMLPLVIYIVVILLERETDGRKI